MAAVATIHILPMTHSINDTRDEYQRFQDTMRELSEELAEYYLRIANEGHLSRTVEPDVVRIGVNLNDFLLSPFPPYGRTSPEVELAEPGPDGKHYVRLVLCDR